MSRRNVLETVWLVLHYWPEASTYSVMPEAYASEGAAAIAALRFIGIETTPGHKYEIKSVALNY
jgi:hypothetical protein